MDIDVDIVKDSYLSLTFILLIYNIILRTHSIVSTDNHNVMSTHILQFKVDIMIVVVTMIVIVSVTSPLKCISLFFSKIDYTHLQNMLIQMFYTSYFIYLICRNLS